MSLPVLSAVPGNAVVARDPEAKCRIARRHVSPGRATVRMWSPSRRAGPPRHSAWGRETGPSPPGRYTEARRGPASAGTRRRPGGWCSEDRRVRADRTSSSLSCSLYRPFGAWAGFRARPPSGTGMWHLRAWSTEPASGGLKAVSPWRRARIQMKWEEVNGEVQRPLRHPKAESALAGGIPPALPATPPH